MWKSQEPFDEDHPTFFRHKISLRKIGGFWKPSSIHENTLLGNWMPQKSTFLSSTTSSVVSAVNCSNLIRSKDVGDKASAMAKLSKTAIFTLLVYLKGSKIHFNNNFPMIKSSTLCRDIVILWFQCNSIYRDFSLSVKNHFKFSQNKKPKKGERGVCRDEMTV